MNKEEAVDILSGIVQSYGQAITRLEWKRAIEAIHVLIQPNEIEEIKGKKKIIKAFILTVKAYPNLGWKIEAIRFTRLIWNMFLKEAKDLVEECESELQSGNVIN